MNDPRPDPELIRITYRWLAHAEHGVSEVRVIRPGSGVLGIGFFDDEDAFVRECERSNAAANVYVGIQPRPRRLLELARNAIRPLQSGAGSKDIEVVTATVIDLDKCRDVETGKLNVRAQAVIESCESYWEISPSGEGVKIFGRGDGWIELTFYKDRVDVERKNGGYFTVTGRGESAPVVDLPLDAIAGMYGAPKKDERTTRVLETVIRPGGQEFRLGQPVGQPGAHHVRAPRQRPPFALGLDPAPDQRARAAPRRLAAHRAQIAQPVEPRVSAETLPEKSKAFLPVSSIVPA